MLRQHTVVNAMNLRSAPQHARNACVKSEIGMRKCPDYGEENLCSDPHRDAKLQWVNIVNFEKSHKGQRDEKCYQARLNPVLTSSGRSLEFLVDVVHFVMLPEKGHDMQGAVIPVEKEIADSIPDVCRTQ
jgi:hypothetical protein